ncbi:MAG: NAD-dependent epimerase/dehydratase family protein [bacterium]|nr:NAD-dependent epimerase/dehydratase family protein [bacterium]
MAIGRVAVLGCGGFVGSHLAEKLLQNARAEVLGFDITDVKCRHLIGARGFNFTQGYLDARSTRAVLEPIIDSVDVVISLAAICNPAEYLSGPVQTIRSNFIDAHALMDLCAERKKWLIHTSSSEVYGRTLASYMPNNTYSDPALFEQREGTTPMVLGPVENLRWTYAAAKALGERYIYALHIERGLPFTIVRPYNWFGPRMDYIPGRDGDGLPRVMACFMQALLDNHPMRLVDGGTAYRTITHIDDGIDALIRMLDRPEQARNQVFNIGNRANEITIRDLARRMREIYADITGDRRYEAHPIETVAADVFYGPGYEDCDRRVPDIGRAEHLLDWQPKIGLEETLRRTMISFHEAFGRDRQLRPA